MPGKTWGPGLTNEEQCKDEGELVDSVAQDVLHHGPRDEGLVAAVGLPQQQGFCGWLGGQCQGGEGVHDEVHPEHLYGLQRGVLGAAGREGCCYLRQPICSPEPSCSPSCKGPSLERPTPAPAPPPSLTGLWDLKKYLRVSVLQQ